MRKNILIFLVLLCGFVTASFATYTKQDFAYGMQLQLAGTGSIYELVVPASVYQHVNYADLRDIRVFNAQEQIVPSVLSTAGKSKTIRLRNIPFFQIAKNQTGNQVPGDLQLKVSRSKDGTVISAKTTGAQRETKKFDYLFDMSALRNIDGAKLILSWQPTSNNWMTTVKLYGSDDLQNWQLINDNITLAQLKRDGQEIVHRSIDLSAAHYRYLLLSRAKDTAAVLPQLTQSVAQWASLEQPQLNWLSLHPNDVVANTGEYFFDAQGHFPVQAIKFILPQVNMAADVQVFSRNDPKDVWSLVGKGSVYDLQGEQRKNLTVQITPSTDRYWRIVADPATGLGGNNAVVELGWEPHLLVFVAQGQGPFMAAYGSAHVEDADTSAENVLRNLQANNAPKTAIKMAYPSAEQVLAGDSAYKPLKAAPVVYSSKQYILWGILAIGVILLLLMAWSLYKQLYKKPSE